MNVQFRVTRRSGDKVYILSEITGYDKSLSVVLSATTDAGAQIPCYSFPYCNVAHPNEVAQVVSDAAAASRQLGFSGHPRNSAEVRFFVIALPWLDIRRWELTFQAIDAEGDVVSECSKRIDVGSAAWNDRLNDFTDAERGNAIEMLDAAFMHDRIAVAFERAVENDDRVVVHARIDMPLVPGSRLDLSFHDVQGEPIDVAFQVIADTIEAEGDLGPARRVLTVSFETDRSNPGVCLTATDAAGLLAPGFAMADIRSLIELLGKTVASMSAADEDPSYDRWYKTRHRASLPTILEQASTRLAHRATFSFVVLYENNPSHHVYDLVWSFLSQSYGRWELILVCRGTAPSSLSDVVDSAGDDRIFIVESAPEAPLSHLLQLGVDAAEGEFVGFVRASDKLSPDALFEFAMAVERNEETDVIYCDSDTYDAADTHSNPVFRPDFSPELLRSRPYIQDLLAIRTQLLDDMVPFDQLQQGAFHYDLVLRATEVARHVSHVPRVLCHLRFATLDLAFDEATENACEASRKALVDHCRRLGISAEVQRTDAPLCCRVRHVMKDTPKVSVVVPSLDNADRLRRCLTSLRDHTHYKDYEVVVLDGGSASETLEAYDRLAESMPQMRVVHIEDASNRAVFLNASLEQAQGQFVLFLHDDVRFVSADPIEGMLGFFQSEDVAAVGAKRLFADGTVEHAGLSVGGNGVAAPLFCGAPASWEGYQDRARVAQDVSAVSTDCMMVRRSAFEQVGGFPADLPRHFGGVDLCLRLQQAGSRVVFTPHVVVSHCLEPALPPSFDQREDTLYAAEAFLVKHRWPERFNGAGDPLVNANLDPDSPFMALRWEA